MMEVYLQLIFYDREIFRRALSRPHISGIVLGREFCPGLEFGLEDDNFEELAHAILSRGKKLILNTPVYLTPELFEPYVRELKARISHGLISQLLVHDLGLLESLPKKRPPVCWDMWGLQRKFPTATAPFSLPFFDLLSSQGVQRFEIPFHYYRSLARNGEKLDYPWQLRVSTYYPVSFSRVCYSRTLSGLPCPACCNDFYLKPQGEPGEGYRVKGPTLLKKVPLPAKIVFPPGLTPDSVLVTAENLPHAEILLKKLSL